MLEAEIKQLIEEGRDLGWIEERSRLRGKMSDADFWTELSAAPLRDDFRFEEPSDLEQIRARRPNGLRRRSLSYGDGELLDRMHGAWLGRCCGCALGKPAEALMNPFNGLSSKERIKAYLQAISPDEYPLKDYFSQTSTAAEKTGPLMSPESCRENLAYMETDDDIRYTIVGQHILREKGAGFTTHDVMKAWIDLLTYAQLCTAETQAYRNHVMRYHVRSGAEEEVDWSWVATHQNPYREWIGAQIRADSFGYAAPGHPELAAEFAWRDARMSHVKNGIYGEMFVAAMIAAAFVLDDPLAIVEAGLSEIPETSRLYSDIRRTIELCQKHHQQSGGFEAVFDGLYSALGHYHPAHTNNNAALVVAALLLGGHDFGKAITIAVMGGWDTDCNGATVGSIVGAMVGAKNIPKHWGGRLNDQLYSGIIGYHPVAISECGRRSFDIARIVLSSAGSE